MSVEAVHPVRTPSVEFNWLPRSVRKGLTVPAFAWARMSGAAGCYCAPENMDALVFSHRFAPDDVSDLWVGWLQEGA